MNTVTKVHTSQKMRKIFLMLAFVLVTLNLSALTYYSQGSGLNPTTLTSWDTNRAGGGTDPLNFTSGDIFVVQGTGGGMGAPHSMNVTVAWTISGANGKLLIEDGATLSLTTNNVTTNALQVDGILNVNAGRTFTLTNGGAAVDLLVNATGIINNLNTFTMSAGTTGTIAGTLNNSNNFTPIGLTFSGASIYNHNRNGGTVPTATWSAGSFCNIKGVTGTVPAGLGQAFSNFEWNCIGQTGSLTATALATINGNFTITSTTGFPLALAGNLAMGAASTLWVKTGTILDASTRVISFGAGTTVSIDGTLRTANTTAGATGGLTGAAGCTFNAPTTLNINAKLRPTELRSNKIQTPRR